MRFLRIPTHLLRLFSNGSSLLLFLPSTVSISVYSFHDPVPAAAALKGVYIGVLLDSGWVFCGAAPGAVCGRSAAAAEVYAAPPHDALASSLTTLKPFLN